MEKRVSRMLHITFIGFWNSVALLHQRFLLASLQGERMNGQAMMKARSVQHFARTAAQGFLPWDTKSNVMLHLQEWMFLSNTEDDC